MDSTVFIHEIADYAVADYAQHPILPSLTIAQAILESGWGESTLAKKANAIFGIKANSSWTGKKYPIKTAEYFDGKKTTVTAYFRAYESWQESVVDHGDFLCGLSRYSNLLGLKDYEKACEFIQQDGYATDPNYATTLKSLINTYKLYQYDTISVVDSIIKSDETGKVFYAVQKGDTLDRIAFMHYTTVGKLVALNNIKNPNLIYVGQRIALN